MKKILGIATGILSVSVIWICSYSCITGAATIAAVQEEQNESEMAESSSFEIEEQGKNEDSEHVVLDEEGNIQKDGNIDNMENVGQPLPPTDNNEGRPLSPPPPGSSPGIVVVKDTEKESTSTGDSRIDITYTNSSNSETVSSPSESSTTTEAKPEGVETPSVQQEANNEGVGTEENVRDVSAGTDAPASTTPGSPTGLLNSEPRVEHTNPNLDTNDENDDKKNNDIASRAISIKRQTPQVEQDKSAPANEEDGDADLTIEQVLQSDSNLSSDSGTAQQSTLASDHPEAERVGSASWQSQSASKYDSSFHTGVLRPMKWLLAGAVCFGMLSIICGILAYKIQK